MPRRPREWECRACSNKNFLIYALCTNCRPPNPHPEDRSSNDGSGDPEGAQARASAAAAVAAAAVMSAAAGRPKRWTCDGQDTLSSGGAPRLPSAFALPGSLGGFTRLEAGRAGTFDGGSPAVPPRDLLPPAAHPPLPPQHVASAACASDPGGQRGGWAGLGQPQPTWPAHSPDDVTSPAAAAAALGAVGVDPRAAALLREEDEIARAAAAQHRQRIITGDDDNEGARVAAAEGRRMVIADDYDNEDIMCDIPPDAMGQRTVAEPSARAMYAAPWGAQHGGGGAPEPHAFAPPAGHHAFAQYHDYQPGAASSAVAAVAAAAMQSSPPAAAARDPRALGGHHIAVAHAHHNPSVAAAWVAAAAAGSPTPTLQTPTLAPCRDHVANVTSGWAEAHPSGLQRYRWPRFLLGAVHFEAVL